MRLPASAIAAAAPAGGAATGQTIAATAGALLITATMLAIVSAHRSGRTSRVARLAAFAERSSGLPGWSALPIAFVYGALGIAVFGMYWDISIHLDKGRDPGPLANDAHYFILAGLFGVFFAGLLAVCLPREGERPSRPSVRLTRDWYAPLGGLLMLISASFALAAFPLDDLWHRLFGQDVTLWGPTHLMLIGGAGLATVGGLILLCEGVHARSSGRKPGVRWLVPRQAALAGSFLVALTTFQAEFDFAVPQFRLVWHPILVMLAAGIGLVTARLLIGRGGALAGLAGYLAIRGLLSVWVGPITGHTPVHFAPYLVEALVVEAVGLRATRYGPLAFGALAGLGIGTIGLAAEWGWSHVWWVIPWTSALLPEGIIGGVLAAVAGGVIGGFVGGSLSAPMRGFPVEARWAPAAAAVVVIGLFAYALPMQGGPPTSARITLHDITPPPHRTVSATIALQPPGRADHAEWLNVTAWQGGGSVVDPLHRVREGVYQTTKPIPVYGNWKATVRLHNGSTVAGLPIYFPEDRAIPVPGIPASGSFERGFVRDKKNLQREQKPGVPGVLTLGAYLLVLAVALGLLGSLAWGLGRFARLSTGRGERRRAAGARPGVPSGTRPASA
ncbi:MAG: hypothetical protein E6G56_10820 [Actinobacteria bacterium]|nr:MAG: hypothetical protein E6G56_10820 [Actinomycetota bacterium]